jgi:hypothetical protein
LLESALQPEEQLKAAFEKKEPPVATKSQLGEYRMSIVEANKSAVTY